MFVEEFCKAGIFDFFQLINSRYELYSYGEVALAFHTIPNNTSFIKYIKLILDIPMACITYNYILIVMNLLMPFLTLSKL